MSQTPKRAVIRLQLDVAAKKALDELCDRRGMTQIATLSRTVKWLVAQDEAIQATILNLISEANAGALAKVLLAKMAAKGGA